MDGKDVERDQELTWSELQQENNEREENESIFSEEEEEEERPDPWLEAEYTDTSDEEVDNIFFLSITTCYLIRNYVIQLAIYQWNGMMTILT